MNHDAIGYTILIVSSSFVACVISMSQTTFPEEEIWSYKAEQTVGERIHRGEKNKPC